MSRFPKDVRVGDVVRPIEGCDWPDGIDEHEVGVIVAIDCYENSKEQFALAQFEDRRIGVIEPEALGRLNANALYSRLGRKMMALEAAMAELTEFFDYDSFSIPTPKQFEKGMAEIEGALSNARAMYLLVESYHRAQNLRKTLESTKAENGRKS
jgi:hypothetical protein